MLKLDNDYVKISLIDGICYGHYKPVVINLRIAKEIVKDRQSLINLRIAKEIVKDRQSLSLGEKHPFIVDIREVKGFRMEAVSYLSGNESMDDVSKLCIIVKSKLVVILYALFSKIATPRIPTKLFTTEKEAKNWINSTLKY